MELKKAECAHLSEGNTQNRRREASAVLSNTQFWRLVTANEAKTNEALWHYLFEASTAESFAYCQARQEKVRVCFHFLEASAGRKKKRLSEGAFSYFPQRAQLKERA